MKNEIDNKQILAVYERIIQRGEMQDDAKHYQGVTAYSDADGYTIYLQGSGVELRFGFHNTYHLDYEHEKQKDDFLKKLHNIANET
ncbi:MULTISPECIES: DUF3081 domain-containing protein [Pseudoalteromonas]|jgi:hypothetical protein|uniref:DUF3081 domain-containing protein n=2 Tax=Pseudoalteromonas TaxID=53246 RepID=A0AAC9UP04_9GAMM|nr:MULTISPECIES: DUF3081 domain-containing protein [Pseudoalteromonas]ASM56141.1 hypothetical protein PNIG_b0577 [Pseudoalteromonas nigrifaciens]PCC10603.1 DUF3081 domain-containing protein [Pseudoalteromonas sp. JB197]SJN38435.1 hypothetical protein CZ797_09160 [Pseudoalteromonas sp. JB197]SUD23564.1 Protein of uncharacterised function (DUF3081) [Pseudoalteromonas nigrifaciens]GEN42187.1 hypothetical protein PNI02_16530 [Pseudoalteromonas nigrifaciens]|tara:strand:- start:30249 stop:30506 length:258 start_codon:yes stop_codon:yes gene_type:complete